MNQRNENFSMILEVLKQLEMKPNKESLGYADKFIKSTGGYKQYYDSFNQYKQQKERISILQSDMPKSKESSIPVPVLDYSKTPDNYSKNVSKDILIEKCFQNVQSEFKIIAPHKSEIIAQNSSLNCDQPLKDINKLENKTVNNQSNILLDQNLELNIAFAKSKKPTLPPKPEYKLNKSTSDELILNKSYGNKTQETFNINNSNRNLLLNSIENFNGNLKHIDSSKENVNSTSQSRFPSTNEPNDIINQLFKALDDMRPYLSKKKRKIRILVRSTW